jgi:hypothetical protein
MGHLIVCIIDVLKHNDRVLYSNLRRRRPDSISDQSVRISHGTGCGTATATTITSMTPRTVDPASRNLSALLAATSQRVVRRTYVNFVKMWQPGPVPSVPLLLVLYV